MTTTIVVVLLLALSLYWWSHHHVYPLLEASFAVLAIADWRPAAVYIVLDILAVIILYIRSTKSLFGVVGKTHDDFTMSEVDRLAKNLRIAAKGATNESDFVKWLHMYDATFSPVTNSARSFVLSKARVARYHFDTNKTDLSVVVLEDMIDKTVAGCKRLYRKHHR